MKKIIKYGTHNQKIIIRIEKLDSFQHCDKCGKTAINYIDIDENRIGWELNYCANCTDGILNEYDD